MGAGEKAGEAVLLTLRILRGGFGGTVTLVALGGALIALDGLGGVGASNAVTGSLAGDVTSSARESTAHLRGETGRRNGCAGDGGSVLGQGEGAGGESEQSGSILHFACFGRLIRIDAMRGDTRRNEEKWDFLY